MSFLTRLTRNIARAKLRTIGVILIVSVSLAAFLILSQIGVGIDANISQARAAVKDVLTVQPAGGSGFFSPGTHITANIEPTVRGTPGVASVQRILLDSPNFQGGGFSGGGPPSGGSRNFTLYEGIDTTSTISLFGGFGGGSTLTIAEGRTLNASEEDSSVAVVGQSFATANSVVVGDSIPVNGSYVTVIGIFSTGGFGGQTVIVPYPIAQTAFAASGPNLLYVTVYAQYNVSEVQGLLQTAVGTNYTVDVPGQNIGGAFANSLQSIISSSQLEEYVALAVGAAVVVLVMVLVTSQRMREIGLLKAFGFTNARILTQLLAESVVVAVAGLPLALALTVWLGPTVAQDVLSSSAGGGFRGGFALRFLGTINYSLTPEIVLLGLGVTVAFGAIGAAYPIVRALRLRPSEILRHE
jgi:putative ABC transport system permease protein